MGSPSAQKGNFDHSQVTAAAAVQGTGSSGSLLLFPAASPPPPSTAKPSESGPGSPLQSLIASSLHAVLPPLPLLLPGPFVSKICNGPLSSYMQETWAETG